MFMNTLVSLLPLVILLLAAAVLIKVSALLLRRTRVSWLHSGVFALAVVIIGVALRALVGAAGIGLPVAAGVVLTLLAYIGFGAWYLSRRATTAAGEPLGYRGAALLSTLACGLLAALAAAAVSVGNAAR